MTNREIAEKMFPRERFYGSMWDEARQKVGAALDEKDEIIRQLQFVVRLCEEKDAALGNTEVNEAHQRSIEKHGKLFEKLANADGCGCKQPGDCQKCGTGYEGYR